MFVSRSSRLLTSGAVLLGVHALGACSDPTLSTDLRPEGPPEVLTVMINNEGLNSVGDQFEHATFCKLNDTKRPGLVGQPDGGNEQVCSDDLTKGAGTDEKVLDPATGRFTDMFTPSIVTDALATAWYARIQFDELLNTDVEELTENLDDMGNPNDTYTGHIKGTAPVTLQCDTAGDGTFVDVPYDGYYQPAGNSVTWPVGPSLVVIPDDTSTVATGSSCKIVLKKGIAVDKDGNSVPDDQLGTEGQYNWKIEALALLGTTPEADPDPTDPNMTAAQDPTAPAIISFNAPIDASSLTASEVILEQVTACDAATGVAKVAAITADMDDAGSIDIADSTATGGNAFAPNKIYRLTFAAGANVTDLAGGPADLPGASDLTLCFDTTVTP